MDIGCSNDQVCAIDGLCVAASDAHDVVVTWTVMGQPPSASTCTSAFYHDVPWELTLEFATAQDESPAAVGVATTWVGAIACAQGAYTVADVETAYDYVTGRLANAVYGSPTVAVPAAGGTIAIDVPPP
jgi:hypothetical protein